jgi:acyl-CoA synthetase (AMP-forming)/AMP-acid ligase II
VAVVVLRRNQAVSSEDLIGYCRQHLAPYKSPKTIVLREELPRNAIGKVLKAELKKTVCSDHS